MMPDWLLSGFLGGWRGLARFWAIVAGLLGAMVVTLQVLGPPDAPSEPVPTAPSPAVAPAGRSAAGTDPAAPRPAQAGVPAPPPSDRPGRATPGPVADPDPALLEPSSDGSSGPLPRVTPDGRRAMQVYAAAFDPQTRRARVGLVLAGVGMNEAESLAAARDLPGGVTFAVSPYATPSDRVLSAIRLAGHETLLSLPMEPTEFPLSDPGPRALMTSLPPEQNLERLHWALGRLGGYVGVTNALGVMRGERFSGMADQMSVVLTELDKRGLLFVDVRAGSGPNRLSWGRAVDLVIDEVATGTQIDQRLEALSRLARDRGSALGLATLPRPVTVARIAAWSNGLLNSGLALAPVSAIALPPAGKDEAK
jgi:polysaccharide deacetylase 2 family uncharacterized protein YibQ